MFDRFLVTGANGFIGSAVNAALRERKLEVRCAVRSSAVPEAVGVGDMSGETDWRAALHGVRCVIHTAARVHDVVGDVPDSVYHRINVEATVRLAEQAARCGVQRLVFLSTIKVNGEITAPGRPFNEDDVPAPQGAYALSKLVAERRLQAIAKETGLEVAIVRPVLVYGPGVKGNFATMMRSLGRGVPLPLGAINNRRSLVGVDNLVSLVIACALSPAAANQTFLASDAEDLSTTELLRRTAAALGRRARLVPVPAVVLEAGAALLGKRAAARRLLGSLQVDVGKARRLLGWVPPLSVDEGLARAAQGFSSGRA